MMEPTVSLRGRPMSDTKIGRRCPCGGPFPDKDPRRAYCSNLCRVKFGRYGKTYGTIVPRRYGWTIS